MRFSLHDEDFHDLVFQYFSIESLFRNLTRPNHQTQSQQKGETKLDKKLEELNEIQNNEEPSLRKKQLLGDCSYIKKDYLQAISYYSEALLQIQTAKLFSKRGQCFKKLKQYNDALKDCLTSLNFDQNYLKSLLIKNICIAAKIQQQNLKVGYLKEIDLCLQELKKGQELCEQMNKKKMALKFQKHKLRINKFKWYLNMNNENEKAQQLLKQYSKSIAYDITLTQDARLQLIEDYQKILNSKLPQIKEIPSQFICQINQEVMLNPTVTEHGLAYEKSALDQHFKVNGYWDPITREECDESYQCHNLKKTIHDYLEENPYAFEYMEGEKFYELKL